MRRGVGRAWWNREIWRKSEVVASGGLPSRLADRCKSREQSRKGTRKKEQYGRRQEPEPIASERRTVKSEDQEEDRALMCQAQGMLISKTSLTPWTLQPRLYSPADKRTSRSIGYSQCSKERYQELGKTLEGRWTIGHQAVLHVRCHG